MKKTGNTITYLHFSKILLSTQCKNVCKTVTSSKEQNFDQGYLETPGQEIPKTGGQSKGYCSLS